MGSIWYIDLVHVDRFWTMQSVGMIPRYMIHASVVSATLCTSVVCTHTLSMLMSVARHRKAKRLQGGVMVSWYHTKLILRAHSLCTHVHICTPLGPTPCRNAYDTMIPSYHQQIDLHTGLTYMPNPTPMTFLNIARFKTMIEKA